MRSNSLLGDILRRGESRWTPLFLVLLGLLLFVPGIGDVALFDWDEINFAESAREMILTGNYVDVQINFQPFWEKPPLFSWLQVLSMKAFGINEFAARFPNAVCGVLTLLTLYYTGKKLFPGSGFGLLWALVYACSLLPFFYFKSGLIDPWFNLFIFLGIVFMTCYTGPRPDARRWRYAVLSALFLGLSTLTKGPVGFLVFCLTFLFVLIVLKFRLPSGDKLLPGKGMPKTLLRDVLLFLLTYAVVGGFWFILQAFTGRGDLLWDNILYQIRLFQTHDAGHGGFLLYHFVILLIGVFPASLFALPTIRRSLLSDAGNDTERYFLRWMMTLLWVVLILFTIVQTKIVHYSSLAYFPITFLASWEIYRLSLRKEPLSKVTLWGTIIVGSLLALALLILPNIDHIKGFLIPYIQDPFAVGNLQADGGWQGWEWIIGLVLIVSIVFFWKYRDHADKAVDTIFAASLVFTYFTVVVITPNVEAYSQRAAIEFYRDRVGEECYVVTGFRSYAPYFYTQRTPEHTLSDMDKLASGEIDKPAYFVLKSIPRNEQEFLKKAKGDITRLYEKNGFVFYRREATTGPLAP